MPILLSEDFGAWPVGPLPFDASAAGEYHYHPPEAFGGTWYDPIRGQWGRYAPWLVVEDEGRRRLLQTVPGGQKIPRVLVTGDPDWRDYAARVRAQPLRADGFVGVAVRYRTARSHYRFGLDRGERIVLQWVEHGEVTDLASAPREASLREPVELRVEVTGARFACFVDGEEAFRVEDATRGAGRVALVAETTAWFDAVEIEMPPPARAAFASRLDARERELSALRERLPKPVLWRRIETPGFGTGRQIRWGHLTSPDRLDFVLAQNLKLVSNSDSLTTVRRLTAMNLDGEVLWQWGEPSPELDAGLVTCDLPVQVYDIDGDGRDEVLCLRNFRLYVLDGATGEVKRSHELPLAPAKENAFGRLVGDAIVIANFRGLDRPRDLLIKNRYRQVWAFTDTFEPLWAREFPTWLTGHFAQPYDFDGDGRDELVIGYCLLGPDGEMRWSHEWDDHTDEIAIGPFDPSRDDVQIGLVCGEAGFNLLDADGAVLHREFLGHAQRLSAARFRDDLPGVQFFVSTYWGEAGILSLHDASGRRLFELEPTALGNVLNPVNWTGTGTELALLSGSTRHGGLLDGHGRRAVVFPDDGHPEMCCEALDLAGDARDEIVLWDMSGLWIYTQDRPFEAERLYRPRRYPHHNASNYRAEISLPSAAGAGRREAPGPRQAARG